MLGDVFETLVRLWYLYGRTKNPYPQGVVSQSTKAYSFCLVCLLLDMVKAVPCLLGIMSKHVLMPILKADPIKTEGCTAQETMTDIFLCGNLGLQ